MHDRDRVELWHPVTTKEKLATLLGTLARSPCRVATSNSAGKMTRLEPIVPWGCPKIPTVHLLDAIPMVDESKRGEQSLQGQLRVLFHLPSWFKANHPRTRSTDRRVNKDLIQSH